ncbi:hypothetical protein U1Q18_018567 [Sarracenia purpurea var. burkii]
MRVEEYLSNILSGEVRGIGRGDDDLTDNRRLKMGKTIGEYEGMDLLCLVHCYRAVQQGF